MYSAYRSRGLQILAFPSNQFGAQEPDTEENILKWATETYGVEFPMLGKCDCVGDDAHDAFKWLQKKTNSEITWNFAKFLIDSEGNVKIFYDHPIQPIEIIPDFVPLLNKQ